MTNLTPTDIAGSWGWKFTNESLYMRSGVAPADIYTDDGIPRTAYPLALEARRTLYDRPQEEWETPTLISFIYTFTADGKFASYYLQESGQMPHGYIKIDLYEQGTYTINNGIVTLTAQYSTSTSYNDLQNSLNTQSEIGRVSYLQLSVDESNQLKINVLKRQPDGTLTPLDPNTPDGTIVERVRDVPLDFSVGMTWNGSLRNDVLLGTPVNDTFDGKAGNDVLITNGGQDIFTGGAGSDRFRWDQIYANGNVTIPDFNPTEDIIAVAANAFGLAPGAFLNASQFHVGAGAADAGDRIIYNAGTGALLFDADGSGAAAPVQIATLPTGLNLRSGNVYAYQDPQSLTNLPGPGPNLPGPNLPGPNPPGPNPPGPNPPGLNPPIQGTSNHDTLTGTNGNDTIWGWDGNDRLNGFNGNDIVHGGSGNDKLYGGNGDDRIWGGTGNDTIWSGAGRDLIVLEKGVGRVVIQDFSKTDKLGLTPGLRYPQLQFIQQGGNLLIKAHNDPLAILVGVNKNQINRADFTSIAASQV